MTRKSAVVAFSLVRFTGAVVVTVILDVVEAAAVVAVVVSNEEVVGNVSGKRVVGGSDSRVVLVTSLVSLVKLVCDMFDAVLGVEVGKSSGPRM